MCVKRSQGSGAYEVEQSLVEQSLSLWYVIWVAIMLSLFLVYVLIMMRKSDLVTIQILPVCYENS